MDPAGDSLQALLRPIKPVFPGGKADLNMLIALKPGPPAPWAMRDDRHEMVGFTETKQARCSKTGLSFSSVEETPQNDCVV